MNLGSKSVEMIAAVMAIISATAFSLHHHEYGLCFATAAVAFFLCGLILYITEKSNPREVHTNIKHLQSAISPSEGVTLKKAHRVISKLTPTEIVSELKNARPFQKEGVAKTFVNIEVTWLLTLESISTGRKDDEVRLFLSDGSTVVFTTTSKKEVSHLALLDKGARLLVSGIIDSVDSISIDMRDATIELADGDSSIAR